MGVTLRLPAVLAAFPYADTTILQSSFAERPVGWAELRDASGRVLRLHTGHDPQAWLALADSFWRQGQ